MSKISVYPHVTPAAGDKFVIARGGKNYHTLYEELGGSAPLPPEGRLTLVTATPVPSTDQIGITSIYYAPYTGDLVPIYDGSSWQQETFTELTLTLDATAGHTGYHQAGKIFDLFVYSDSGTLRLVSGPAWTNDSTRSVALERINGVLMNAAVMTARYGSALGETVSVAQDRGTYVGTFYATGNGQATDSRLQRTLWNYYNRRRKSLLLSTATASWAYTTGSWRQANNSISNQVAVVVGFAEDEIHLAVVTSLISSGGGTGGSASIGEDSTTTPHADAHHQGGGGVTSAWIPFTSTLDTFPSSIGYHYYTWLEYGGANITFYGTGAFWRAGISGSIMC